MYIHLFSLSQRLDNKMSSNKAREETSKTVMDQGVGCNLDKELSPHDIEFLSKLRLSEEQLKLKETDVQAFWKSVSQSVAAELSDSLEDNRDVRLSLFIFSIYFIFNSFNIFKAVSSQRTDGGREP